MVRVLIGVCIPTMALAVPLELSHSGRLTDALGTPIEGTVTLDLALHVDDETQDTVWTQQTTDVVVQDGYFSVVLGPGGSPALDQVLTGASLWLSVKVDNSELEDRTRLVSVPYAVRAGNVTGPAARSTYTTWGSTACAGGGTPLWTGTPAVTAGPGGGGGAFCLDDANASSSGWVAWDEAFMTRQRGGSGHRSQYSETGDFQCAVCEGQALTRHGHDACPDGWTKLYDGYTASIMVHWTGSQWNGGDTFCLDDSASAAWTNWTSGEAMVLRTRSSSSRVEYLNDQSVRCAVCY